MFTKSFTLMCAALLCVSCLKQQESITPIAAPATLAELQKEALMRTAELAGNSELSEDAKATLELAHDPSIFYLNVKYHMKNIDVFAMANMPNTFEQIGHSFLQTIAKLVLAIGGPRQIDISNINLHIPDSVNLDRSIVKSIAVKKIFLQYSKDVDEGSDYKADFSFINTLELAREVTVPKIGRVDQLFLSYRKVQNLCMYKCIQFEILEDNLIDLLTPNSNLLLKPSLTIDALPAVNNLTLDGEIELKIGLKLPF